MLSPWALLLLPAIYYLLPYLSNHGIRDIPGPKFAAFTSWWLLLQARRGKRYLAVDNAHRKYGTLVRIQPDHVSVSDPDAIPIIYSHTGGWLKSDYYDAFVSIQRGLFNTRDRAEHTRKRKTISHTFSTKSINQFEPYIKYNLDQLVLQWDRLSKAASTSGEEYADIDCLHWFNYLAFDIIGDLAFGAPFNMLPKGADIAEVRKKPGSPLSYAPAIMTLNRRGEVSSTIGCLPGLKPYAKYMPDPFFRNGVRAVENLAGIAVARVNARLDAPEQERGVRKDLLSRLMEGRDEKGEKLGRAELTAEALTQLIAGSDTTSNTSCAGLYWILKTPGVMERLQRELDSVIPDDVVVPDFNMVKDLAYLRNVINETLRIHSTSSLGLPRVVPPGRGVTLCNYHFSPGIVLSVPAFTIHHSQTIWNPQNDPVFDPNVFNPDRWEPQNLNDLQRRSFIPFSFGPRGCVGRNVAEMELILIFSTFAKRYDFELREKGPLETREGFLRKPVRCKVGLKKR